MREWESERERQKDEESMRIRKERKSPEKQMCRNCMPTMNVNTLWPNIVDGIEYSKINILIYFFFLNKKYSYVSFDWNLWRKVVLIKPLIKNWSWFFQKNWRQIKDIWPASSSLLKQSKSHFSYSNNDQSNSCKMCYLFYHIPNS